MIFQDSKCGSVSINVQKYIEAEKTCLKIDMQDRRKNEHILEDLCNIGGGVKTDHIYTFHNESEIYIFYSCFFHV